MKFCKLNAKVAKSNTIKIVKNVKFRTVRIFIVKRVVIIQSSKFYFLIPVSNKSNLICSFIIQTTEVQIKI